ncbi:MAG: M48 family peptidase [Moraxellaceae bacterium]|nr:MAG: M48 family peptidase [Moraxellaceae bacterium]
MNSTTGVDRRQLLLVSSDQINQAAAQSYQQTLNEARQKGILNPNAAQLQRIQRIANRLIPQVNVYRPDARTWNWQVNMLKSNELNAYCAPGGKIMFYTGIIDRLKLTDDEIAAIMGHEMAHALREHGRERASRSSATQLGLSVLASAVGLTEGQAQVAGMATQLGLDLPFNRSQESEADSLGLELMARAGYNPQAAVTLWNKMSAASQGEPPQFLSTHPGAQNRIRTIQSLLPRVTPLYQQARR